MMGKIVLNGYNHFLEHPSKNACLFIVKIKKPLQEMLSVIKYVHFCPSNRISILQVEFFVNNKFFDMFSLYMLKPLLTITFTN